MLPELKTAIPGPKSLAMAGELMRHESRNVTYMSDEWPVFWERAEGVNVWDVDGNRYLDLTSAFGVASLGHSHPAVIGALQEQASRLIHAMGDVHPTPLKAELCRRLSAMTFERWGLGAGKVILGNSGSDAIEAALKTSLLYSGKPGVIAFAGAYHGLGMGALTAGGLPFFREPFRAQLKEIATLVSYPSCYRCPYGTREDFRLTGGEFPNCSTTCLGSIHEEILRVIGQREIGCILVEPVQGRGGVVPPPRDFLPMLRRICDEEKILLIVDEILTGFNRTGALFACEHSGVTPDVICLGKGLASGFPISACVARADIMDAWPESSGEALHTSTFLGNPLGCAMALASIGVHAEPGLAAQVRATARALRAGLGTLNSERVGNVRGVGLMQGVEIVKGNGALDTGLAISIVQRALKDGLLLLADGQESNVLSLMPPFSIGAEEIDFVVGRLRGYLSS